MSSSPQSAQLKNIGALGGVRATGVSNHSGDYMAIKALGSDVTIVGATGNINGLDGAVIPQGDTVLGVFSNLSISGDAILYND